MEARQSLEEECEQPSTLDHLPELILTLPLHVANLSLLQEETGYRVKPESITYIATSVASAGTSGSKHHMFYAEVRTCP